jgi:hypothetical protein
MRSLGGLAIIFALAAGGCGGSDPYGPPLMNNNNSGGNGSGGGGGGGQCSTGPALTPMDPATLPSCGTAVCADSPNAHCVSADKVPSNIGAQLAKCSDGSSYCVPDAQIKSGGAAPPHCKSLNAADGVCLSVCVPQVKQYETLLPQDSCATDERCAPCINPLNMMPSGACDIGKAQSCDGGNNPPANNPTPPPPACPYVGPPLVDVSKLPSCGGGAHCVAATLVPPAMASQLAACVAPNSGLCAPDNFIQAAGNFIPKTCASLDAAEGRCLNVVIPQVKAEVAQLTQDVCTVDEKCVPCFSPLDGKPTGACKLSCDPGPTKPAVVFASCCNMNNADYGRCVPKTIIPMSLQSNLGKDSCANTQTDLCVPSENLDPNFKPTACTGQGLIGGAYTGVCLSKCLSFGFIQSLGISQGSCDNLHDCAPCTNPLTGQPTGAPGCPP